MTIKPWTPFPEFPDNLSLNSMEIVNRVLKIKLEPRNNKKTIINIEFDSFYGFRFFNESERLAFFEPNSVVTTQGSMFCFANSEFVDWLVEESCSLVEAKEVVHYYIATDDIIEVLSKYPPVVTITSG